MKNKDSKIDILRRHLTFNKRVINIILLLIALFEVVLIVRCVASYDLTQMRTLLYLISYITLFVFSMGGCVVLHFVKEDNEKSLMVAYIYTYVYVTIICGWTLLISYLDIANGGAPITFLTVFIAIPACCIVKPYFYSTLAIICTVVIIIFDSMTSKQINDGFVINMVIYCLITIYITFKSYHLDYHQYVAEEALEKMSYTDQLTKLNNRRALDLRIDQVILNCQKGYVILADIDDFKEVNDTHGHVFGDECLVAVAKVLNDLFTPDNAYRYGGDEFAIVTNLELEEINKKLQLCNERLAVVSNVLKLRLSFGIYCIDHNDSAIDLFMRADKELYKNKKNK